MIFKLSKAGKIQVLHNVCNSCSEGAEPSNLILASDGNFYGTAEDVLFRVTPAGAYTVLLTSAGNQPPRGVVQASDGNLYGTTIGGLTIPTPFFRITRAGQFTTLHTFSYPDFASNIPIQGADGKLYGNSTAGLFVSNLSGSDFQEFPISGYAGLSIIQASDLNLWSPVFSEQDAVNGVIHQISTKGSLLQTIAFDGTNGNGPFGPLVQGSDGKIYGVTNSGGIAPAGETPNGVVFALEAGLAPPKPGIVSFNPSSGAAGVKVTIHGSHFVGTKAVSFNGASASFRVLNTGNIVATVPAGSTAGPLAVTNAGGTVKSAKSFTVE